ncbi:MAG: DUF4373 domain-containing protein [Bacteroidales bacterium]|nr:DUF4373 domain-containing protein [Bacteroidales bacterium]
MKKEVHYFRHDSNARNDEKLLSIRRGYGMEGYGVYWAIIEKLRETAEYSLPTDYSYIAWELHVSEELVKHIVEEHELFIVEDGEFRSIRLCKDMKEESKKKEARRIAGIKGMQSRWGNSGNQPQQTTQTELPLSTPPNPTTKPPQPTKTRAKKYSPEETQLHTKCKECFDAAYSQFKGNAFYWKAKDMAAIYGIIKQIRFQMDEADKDNLDVVYTNFQAFVHAILNRADDWTRKNISPTLIDSKFNEIYTQLKNNTHNGNQNANAGSGNARDDASYLASLVAAIQPGPNK